MARRSGNGAVSPLASLLFVLMSTTTAQVHSTESSSGARPASRVVLITCVFGKHPSYVPLFLKTAEHSGVDVILVGDTSAISGLPRNVRQISMTWEHLVGLVSANMFDGKELPHLMEANRYKVVDLKPAFGFLLREYIAEYDFW